jgi:hypothetical protein
MLQYSVDFTNCDKDKAHIILIFSGAYQTLDLRADKLRIQ